MSVAPRLSEFCRTSPRISKPASMRDAAQAPRTPRHTYLKIRRPRSATIGAAVNSARHSTKAHTITTVSKTFIVDDKKSPPAATKRRPSSQTKSALIANSRPRSHCASAAFVPGRSCHAKSTTSAIVKRATAIQQGTESTTSATSRREASSIFCVLWLWVLLSTAHVGLFFCLIFLGPLAGVRVPPVRQQNCWRIYAQRINLSSLLASPKLYRPALGRLLLRRFCRGLVGLLLALSQARGACVPRLVLRSSARMAEKGARVADSATRVARVRDATRRRTRRCANWVAMSAGASLAAATVALWSPCGAFGGDRERPMPTSKQNFAEGAPTAFQMRT